MTTDPQTLGSRRRIWKAVCVSIVVLGAAFVAAESIYRHYTDPERVRAVAEDYLQSYVTGRVTIGSATVSLFNGVRLFDVSISQPPQSTEVGNRPVFSCEEIEISHSPLAALVGRLEIRSLVAFEPTCTIVHNAAVGTTNLPELFHGVGGGTALSTVSLPTVELRNARVRVLDRRSDGDHEVENLRLTVRGRPSRKDARLYDVVWQGTEDSAARGHSQIDLRTGCPRNVFGGLPAMSVEAVMLAVNATYDGAGALRDLLGLGGKVRARDYNLIDDSSSDRPRSVTIDLQDATVSIPIDDEDASHPLNRRYLRFNDVNGTVQFTTEEIRATFTGSFYGSACEVSAVLRGGLDEWTSLDDVDFEAELSVTELQLPRPDSGTDSGTDSGAPEEQRRFINAWPRLARFYERYDPTGPVDLTLAVVKRAGEEESLVLRRAVVIARGTSASYHRFPYRIDKLTGNVELTPNGVWIRRLCGEHAGGTICVDGSLEHPGKHAAADIKVTGRNVPIDDRLLDSLKPNYRKICEEFSPEGTINVAVTLTRPSGTPGDGPAPWNRSTTVTFDDLRASYEKFPYPVEGLTGTLRLDRDRFEIVDLSGRSGDARIDLSGALECDASGAYGFNLDIRATNVPFDDRLLDALPPDLRKTIEPLHPGGQFDVEGTLSRDLHTPHTTPRLAVTLAGASIRHEAFPVEITDIHGRLDIAAGEILASDLVGKRDDATISAGGAYRREGTNAGLDMTVQCRNLRVDDALRAAAPPKLRDLLTTWRVDGPLSADVQLNSDPQGGQAALTYRTVVRMDGVSVTHPLFPAPFTNVRGVVTFDDAGSRATDVQALYDSATVQVDFVIEATESGNSATIAVVASDIVLDRNSRTILPDAWQATWDRLQPTGRIDLTIDRLHFERGDPNGTREWDIDGTIQLRDVALPGIADADRLLGSVSVTGALVDRLAGTTLAGSIDLATAGLLGRSLQNVTTPWSYARTADGGGRFALDDIRGELYGGLVTARAEVLFDGARTEYELSSTVYGMDIKPFLNAVVLERAPAATKKPIDVRGRADSHINLSGRVGDTHSRRGTGGVEIIDGYIHKLPLIIAILNVLDLTAPNDDAFDDAAADFYIVGDDVYLQNIVLRGGVLALVGSGSMSLRHLSVDLNLVNVTPEQWTRLPILTEVIEGASRELVELRVTGPIEQPTVQLRPLPRLNDELRKLFQRKKPKKVTPDGS